MAVWRDFRWDEHGGSTVLLAFSMTVVLGSAALAVDYARGLATQQALASAADVAALAAASRLPDVDAARKTAMEYIEKNLPKSQHGQVLNMDDIDVGTWNPETGRFHSDDDDDGNERDSDESLDSSVEYSRLSFASTDSYSSSSTSSSSTGFSTYDNGGIPAVRITTRRATSNGNALDSFFAWILGRNSMQVSASAVAGRTGPPCVLALNPTEASAARVDFFAKLETVGCGIQINSTAMPAFQVTHKAAVTAADLCVSGTAQLDNPSNVDPDPREHCPGMKDPMAGLALPDPGGCDYVDAVFGGGEITLEPGVYCGGLKLGKFLKPSNITFSPGLYIIQDGPLSTIGLTSITGSEVSLFFTGDGATLAILPGTKIDLTAPTNGPLKGLLIFQDPEFTGTHFIGGFSAAAFRGVIYLPSSKLISQSDSSMTPEGSCLVLIADTLEFKGFSNLAIDITKASCRATLPGPYSRGIVLLD